MWCRLDVIDHANDIVDRRESCMTGVRALVSRIDI
jgi:hypothetical protein